MNETVTALLRDGREWGARALESKWLDESDLAALKNVEHARPADLFSEAGPRPVVVAFFGGTGVGKSSLLNRVAGRNVARTGVERPTSREVTLYLHASVELAELPRDMPVEHVRIARHDAPSGAQLAWLDAPDIDSTEVENRRLVDLWLPFVDLLVYVVSPERYRDDAGWRVLRERGRRHGWLFVMNHWDEGDRGQRADLTRILNEAGFENPHVLCTSCAANPRALPTPDEFETLRETIDALLAEHGARELERLGHRARLTDLRGALRGVLARLGDANAWDAVSSTWRKQWSKARADLLEGVEWPLRTRAARLAVREHGLTAAVLERLAGGAGRASDAGRASPRPDGEGTRQPADARRAGEEMIEGIWDEWMGSRVEECLDRLEVEITRAGMRAAPLREEFDEAAAGASQLVTRSVQNEVRAALGKPGSALQRGLRRATGFLCVLLPGLALLWVTHGVVRGYWQATTGAGAFLGTNFAVHSALLVLVAWAIPFAADRMLRPSLERAALSAMRRGVAQGIAALAERLDGALDASRTDAEAFHKQAELILARVARVLDGSDATPSAALRRFVSRSGPVERAPRRTPVRAEAGD